MNSSSGDNWYVKLADGDVHRVTLDQLDEAFQAGHIDGETMVLASGGSEWNKLGELLGLDDDAVPIEAAPAMQDDTGYIPQLPPPGAARTAPAYAASAPVGQSAYGAQHAYSRSSYAPPSYAAPSYAPPAYAATSYAPPANNGYASQVPTHRAAGVPSYAPAASRAPNSLRPVSVDFSDDMDMAQLRPRSGKAKWVVAVMTVAALGSAAGMVAVQRPAWAQPTLNRLGLRGHEDATVAVAPPPPVEVVPPPAAAPPPPAAEPTPPVAVAAAAPGADSPLNPHFTNQSDRLTDDQKQRVLDADKKGHGKKGHSASAHASGPAPKTTKSTTFTTGGSKYDPLNSSI
jgi:hypothetical protein